NIYIGKTDEFVSLYEEAFPDFSPQGLLSIDTVFRPLTIIAADAWSQESNAPVYSYFLAWKSPVDDNTKGSFDGLDIPLAFSNVDLKQDWTGTTEESYKIASIMSSGWLRCVRTG